MDLTVVVPVYNVENYIEKCVLSILNQRIRKMEILLINDGSTDNSGQICNRLASENKQIKVWHKENGGLSDARNYGLNKATGKFIAFVDSDDFLKADTYGVLLKKAKDNDLDIVIGNGIKYISRDEIYYETNHRKDTEVVYKGQDFLVKLIEEKKMNMQVMLNLYRRDLILDNELFFGEGLFHEDELWTPQVFLKAKKVQHTDVDFYYYREREGSITQREDKTKNALDLLKIVSKLNSVYSNLEDQYAEKILKDYLVMLYLNAFYIGKLYRKEYNKLIDCNFLLKNAYSFRNKFKTFLFCIDNKMYYRLNYFLKK